MYVGVDDAVSEEHFLIQNHLSWLPTTDSVPFSTEKDSIWAHCKNDFFYKNKAN